jgi:hypothetical protein
MKIEINNLTALIQGRDLTLYQRSLAVEEWHKLLNHVDEMEQALSLAGVVGRSEQSCKHPDSCAMGYYHQIGDYYCSKCQKTGLQD